MWYEYITHWYIHREEGDVCSKSNTKACYCYTTFGWKEKAFIIKHKGLYYAVLAWVKVRSLLCVFFTIVILLSRYAVCYLFIFSSPTVATATTPFPVTYLRFFDVALRKDKWLNDGGNAPTFTMFWNKFWLRSVCMVLSNEYILPRVLTAARWKAPRSFVFIV